MDGIRPNIIFLVFVGAIISGVAMFLVVDIANDPVPAIMGIASTFIAGAFAIAKDIVSPEPQPKDHLAMLIDHLAKAKN